jgi:hypothetical protein
MLVFIDESGCPGFKITKGSDPVFGVGMVTFATPEDAAATEAVIRKCHTDIPHRPEFKFSKCSDSVRDKFFAAIASCPFQVCAVVVRKERIYSPTLRAQPDKFYNYFLKLLVDGRVEDAKIRLDGSGGREFERALKTYLRRELAGKIADFRMVDSERDQLSQLADMCIGAIARSYREARGDRSRWRNALRPRITNVWDFH